MADIVKVDTKLVETTAKNIANYNNKILNDFSSVESAMKALDTEWVGNASTNAMGSFFEIKNAFIDVRFDVVQDYVKFLNEQVNAGYELIENNNKYLATLFKD
jgi:hypothetical protein